MAVMLLDLILILKKLRIANEKGITAINPAEGSDQVKFVETFTRTVSALMVL